MAVFIQKVGVVSVRISCIAIFIWMWYWSSFS